MAAARALECGGLTPLSFFYTRRFHPIQSAVEPDALQRFPETFAEIFFISLVRANPIIRSEP